MAKKILYSVIIIVIVVGAVISYKQLDFGGKTSIFFKIVFGDQSQMMNMPRKIPPFQGGQGAFKPPEGFQGGHRGEFRPGRGGNFENNGKSGFQEPPMGKRGHGKPGMGKTISLAKVIPYFFILAFFALATRVIDRLIKR